MSKNKIQSLLVSHLLKHGQIEILLPNNITLEIGITQEGKDGEVVKKDDYCWVITSRDGRSTSIDSYNLGLKFNDVENILVLEDRFTDQNGEAVRRVDVI